MSQVNLFQDEIGVSSLGISEEKIKNLGSGKLENLGFFG